ncbi:MAG TPA: TrkA family potassium uptake protein [Candidatus Limnocylindria bacterium]|nr:TrkA family potassium uptake protein [Candidatus Limnocylindria bacterium]
MANRDRKQFVIFGIGRFGSALARKLAELGHEVLAVDTDEERVNAIAPYVTNAMQIGPGDEEAMRSLGIRNFDAAVVAIGEDLQHSIMMTIMCKEMGARYLISKASDAMHAKVLARLGADRVVFPERDMGERLAHSIINPHVLDLINLKGDYVIANLDCPPGWIGKTLREVDVRRQFSVSVLALYRGGEMNMDVGAGTVLREGDSLMVLGRRKDVDRIERLGE